jgi:hypothetical protein
VPVRIHAGIGPADDYGIQHIPRRALAGRWGVLCTVYVPFWLPSLSDLIPDGSLMGMASAVPDRLARAVPDNPCRTTVFDKKRGKQPRLNYLESSKAGTAHPRRALQLEQMSRQVSSY